MSVNKSYNQEQKLKKKELDVLFNKVLIKLSLNITNKTSYPLALNLLREEIQKIICISILMEFNLILYSFLQSSSKNIDIDKELLVDIILKVLLLSAKQKITVRLSLKKKQKFIKLSSSNEWFLKDMECGNHYLFIVILKWLFSSDFKKSSSNLIESLIENFVIQLSNIIVYEIFYDLNSSRIFFIEYSTDFIVLKKNLRIIKAYVYPRQLYHRIQSFLKRTYNYSYPIIICSRYGFILKNLNFNSLYPFVQVNEAYTPFLDILTV